MLDDAALYSSLRRYKLNTSIIGNPKYPYYMGFLWILVIIEGDHIRSCMLMFRKISRNKARMIFLGVGKRNPKK